MTRLRILHVDDTDSDRMLLARLVDRLDVATELVHASSYEVGLEAMCSGGFDVCLLDYRLGVRTGIELLRALKVRHRLAYLFISHDLRVIRALSDEIIVMRGGVVVERGPTDEIFERPQHPYTRALLAAALDLEVVEHDAVAS